MHDWYHGADPARLLTLASEWNLKVSGLEWENPKLLHGRLASTVLKEMYQAENTLGSVRYRRISNMVDNCVVGRSDATALAKIFFIANELTEQFEGPVESDEFEELDDLAWDEQHLEEAYDLAIKRNLIAPWDTAYRDASPADQSPSAVMKSRAPLPSADSGEVDIDKHSAISHCLPPE